MEDKCQLVVSTESHLSDISTFGDKGCSVLLPAIIVRDTFTGGIYALDFRQVVGEKKAFPVTAFFPMPLTQNNSYPTAAYWGGLANPFHYPKIFKGTRVNRLIHKHKWRMWAPGWGLKQTRRGESHTI